MGSSSERINLGLLVQVMLMTQKTKLFVLTKEIPKITLKVK